MFSYVIETHVEVWENSKLRGNTRPTGSCSHFNFSFTQTSTCVSITETWKMFSISYEMQLGPVTKNFTDWELKPQPLDL